jgi:exodeoxyribonuclease VII large subunit
MADQQPLRLSELTTALERFFSKNLGGRTFWVIGEVSSHQARPAKGWHFFDLIEKAEDSGNIIAKMNVVAWRPAFTTIQRFERETGQQLTNGLEVMIKCEVSFHAQYGMKLTMSDISTSFTLGKMAEHRRKTLEKLLKLHPEFIRQTDDGYSTQNQELDLPRILKKIAVVTSEGAAGFEDFVHTLTDNTYGYTFSLDYYFSGVQGGASAKTLARRVLEISEGDYDLAVIIRGGGAQADLFVFDDFVLNRELAKAAVPFWIGIGHQRDNTIADLFGHQSHKTPTRVAEAILQHNRRSEEHIAWCYDRLKDRSRKQLQECSEALERSSSRLLQIVPGKLHEADRELRELAGVLRSKGGRYASDARVEVDRLAQRLVTHSGRMHQKASLDLQSRQRDLVRSAKRVIDQEVKTLEERKVKVAPGAARILKREHELLAQQVQLLRIGDPQRLLERGYALLELKGKVVANSKQIPDDAELTIRTAQERLSAKLIGRKTINNK